jgi:hypothetical protein
MAFFAQEILGERMRRVEGGEEEKMGRGEKE